MTTSIEDVASLRRGRHLGQKEADPSNGEPTGAVKIKNIAAGTIAEAAALDRAHLPPDQLGRHALAAGDILIAVTGSNPKVAVVTALHSGCVANQGLAVLSPRDSEAGRRLLTYLASDQGQDDLRGLQTGVTIPSISVANLRTLVLPAS